MPGVRLLHLVLPLLIGFLSIVTFPEVARSQAYNYDPSWYDANATHVKISVEEDGVFRFTGNDLASAGVPLGSIEPNTLQLLENGIEIPIWFSGDTATMDASDAITFVGKRNDGVEEGEWAYYPTVTSTNQTPNDELQSSSAHSLFTPVRNYWLTWGGEPGLRYANTSLPPEPGAVTVTNVTQTYNDELNFSYYAGDSGDSGHPYYTHSEGYYWHNFNQVTIRRDSVIVAPRIGPFVSNPNINVDFQARVVAGSRARHIVILKVRMADTGDYEPVAQADWTGYEHRTLTASIPSNEVYRWQGQVYIEIVSVNHEDNVIGPNPIPNKVFTDWFQVTTSRNLTSTSAQPQFSFPSRGGGNYAYTLDGFEPGPVEVYDPITGRRFAGNADGSGTFVFGDNNNSNSHFWTTALDNALSPSSISVDTGSDLANPTNIADYLIITGPGMRQKAEELASFHQSRHGYSVQIIDIQDVFDQFDYGRKTPVAIRRFLQETQNWNDPPRFAMLWGDARYANPAHVLQPWEVPTYGFAGSDSWFVQGLNGKDDLNEFMAIGRIPVRNNTDANIFLTKIADYVDAPFEDWQNRAYLLTGGTGTGEQSAFQNASIQWAELAANEPAGADTSFFFKTSSTILDASLRDSLRVALRHGAGVVSYFGHSSSQTWEIVTDPASEFDNEGKLPLVLSFGCRTGAYAQGLNADEDAKSLAEEFLLDAESGAIAHWGSSEVGTISDSRRLATMMFGEMYPDTSRTLGTAIQHVKNTYAAQYQHEWGKRHMLQYNLIGDPGVLLQLPDKPDFHITQQLTSFDPVIPLTADSTVHINIALQNRGYIPSDSLTVSIVHTAPDGSEVVINNRIESFAVVDTLSLPIPIRDIAGEHHYAISVDPGNEYVEMREDNNTINTSHLVFSNGLTIVAPELYGVADRTPLFRVSIASQVGIDSVPVRFQLDKVSTFDSAALRTKTSTLANAFADWQVTSPLADNQVYYWRATIDNPEDSDANWTTGTFSTSSEHASNFTFIQQDVQWQANVEENIRLEWSEDDGWQFIPYTVSVFANSDRAGQTFHNGTFQVNGENYLANTAGFGIIVLDGTLGTVKAYTDAVTYPNPFGQNPSVSLTRLQDVVDQIEPEDYFFIRTRHLQNLGGPEIDEAVKDVFRNIGMVAIDTLTYDHLWLARGQLGNANYTEEYVVPPEDDVPDISWTQKLSFPFREGTTTSPLIGPSQGWNTLASNYTLPGNGSSVIVDVLSQDGDILLEDLDLSSVADISSISTTEHPYIRLEATLSDLEQTGIPQLDNWRVGYIPVADLVVDASASEFPEDSFQEGSTNSSTIVVRNLSAFDSTPVTLEARYTDPENNTEAIGSGSLPALPPGESGSVEFELPSLSNVGTNLFHAQASQSNVSERIIYNNVLLAPFDVFADNTRPVLTVTVDGLMFDNAPGVVLDLQSAEIPFVSARPSIEVVVSDENPYLKLDDPSTFEVALDRLPLTSEQFTFTPATEESNEARILFEPDLTGVDTVHTFTVRALDATGNYALVDPTVEDSTLYQVHFRVQTALAIESLYPYPNPMSTRTRLMFRMGGESASLVNDFRIRIYTINGRLVREFDLTENPELLERGGLSIGWNSVPWDGTDEDGDPVASGVYFYKVFVSDSDGQEHAINNANSIDRIALIR